MKKLIIFTMICCCVSVIKAQENAIFTVKVNSDTVNLDNAFEVAFTVEGNATKFQQPAFEHFEVIYQNQSTQLNMTNGEMKQSKTYTFGLQAKEEGTFVIEAAKVTINGAVYQTDFLKIVVDNDFVMPEKPVQEEFFDPFRNFGFPSVPKYPQTPKVPKKPAEKEKDRKVYKI